MSLLLSASWILCTLPLHHSRQSSTHETSSHSGQHPLDHYVIMSGRTFHLLSAARGSVPIALAIVGGVKGWRRDLAGRSRLVRHTFGHISRNPLLFAVTSSCSGPPSGSVGRPAGNGQSLKCRRKVRRSAWSRSLFDPGRRRTKVRLHFRELLLAITAAPVHSDALFHSFRVLPRGALTSRGIAF